MVWFEFADDKDDGKLKLTQNRQSTYQGMGRWAFCLFDLVNCVPAQTDIHTIRDAHNISRLSDEWIQFIRDNWLSFL